MRHRKRRSVAATVRAAPAAVALALLAGPAPATVPAEPGLRLSRTLSQPAAGFPDEERALLRAEYRAAQAAAAEADIVGDILRRIRHIDGMIGDIHGLLAAWPAAAPAATPAAAPVAAPAPPAMPVAGGLPKADGEGSGSPASGATLALRALMASVIIFLFWLLGKRHHYIKAQRLRAGATPPDLSKTPTIIPEGDALVAMPAPAAEPAMEREPATSDAAALPPAAATAEPAAADAEIQVLSALEFELVEPPVRRAAASEPPPPDFDVHADQSLELAEIMVSMGLAQGAADALTDRIRNNPKRALFHWLKLLEVYRRAQMQDEFERTAQELRQAFNVQPAAWVAGAGGISLEDFPHLIETVLRLWPTPECTAYLNGLLEDNRGGTRNGLPQSVAEEILLLERILNAEAAAA